MDRNQQSYGGPTNRTVRDPSPIVEPVPCQDSFPQIGLKNGDIFTGSDDTALKSVIANTAFAARWSSREWGEADHIRYFFNHLGGKARLDAVNFCLLTEEEKGIHPTYDEIVNHLTKIYQQVVTPEQKICQLVKYVNAGSASFDSYVQGFRSMVQELPAYYHRDASETYLCVLFKTGLSSEARSYLAALPKPPMTWQTTVEVLQENPLTVQSMNKTSRPRQ